MVTTFTVSDAISELTYTSFIFSFPGPPWQVTFPYYSAATNSINTADIELFTDNGMTHVANTSDTIAEIVMYDHVGGQPMITISGLSLKDSDFQAAISNNSDGINNYLGLVGLLNGDVVVNGPNVDYPFFEVGGGGTGVTATVNAGPGNDVVYVWQAKNVIYNGGAGSDTLIFQSYTGGPFPDGSPPTGAVVDLKHGTGTNPWGGTLTLSGINNIVGTDHADYFVANDNGDVFGDGIYDTGADTILGGAGNDTVNLAEGFLGANGGVHADGGGGINTITVNFHATNISPSNELDLLDQSKNAGIFGGDVLTNFQVFLHGHGFWTQGGQTFIFIDNNQPHHTVEAMGQTNTITFHGGNDTLVLIDTVFNYVVNATGAGGNNILDMGDLLLNGTNTFDFANQSKNSGIFAHVTFSNVESITGAHVVIPDGELVVIGGKGPESMTGTYTSDLLRAGSGNDTMNGGGGDDTIIGGPGHDVFIFDSSLRPRQHTVTLNNFSVTRDKIELDKAIFLGVGHNGVLAKAHFDTGPHAHRASDRIIYNSHTGGLFYHAPGTPLAQQVEFAVLAKHLVLTHADFFVI
jgi:hypothetical protein